MRAEPVLAKGIVEQNSGSVKEAMIDISLAEFGAL